MATRSAPSPNIRRTSASVFDVKDLHVAVGGAEIIKGLTLSVPAGETHAIMGPNGSGKSTLAYVLAGREDYEVTGGDIRWNGESILAMEPDERAAKGVFLAFQYPMEIPGVGTMTFLRTSLNATRKKRGEKELTTPEFMKLVKAKATDLGVKDEMLKRPLNVGFSGGEKKRMEVLQMSLLEPSLAVLDETDSVACTIKPLPNWLNSCKAKLSPVLNSLSIFSTASNNMTLN